MDLTSSRFLIQKEEFISQKVSVISNNSCSVKEKRAFWQVAIASGQFVMLAIKKPWKEEISNLLTSLPFQLISLSPQHLAQSLLKKMQMISKQKLFLRWRTDRQQQKLMLY